jgi:hypothetical protein
VQVLAQYPIDEPMHMFEPHPTPQALARAGPPEPASLLTG